MAILIRRFWGEREKKGKEKDRHKKKRERGKRMGRDKKCREK